MGEIKIEILRYPTEEDWQRCKMLALNTMGLRPKSGSIPDTEWRKRILRAEHSPIRTLMFTIKMEIPYYVSTHFVRHKIGVEHFVSTQRNDRQDKYDRTIASQGMMVTHIMDLNIQQLMYIANKRLCTQADVTTRMTMGKIRTEVLKVCPELKEFLVPACIKTNGCREFNNCGYYERVDKEGF